VPPIAPAFLNAIQAAAGKPGRTPPLGQQTMKTEHAVSIGD
jgi:CO/xanthine dehydrogenase Mo-binding subunit